MKKISSCRMRACLAVVSALGTTISQKNGCVALPERALRSRATCPSHRVSARRGRPARQAILEAFSLVLLCQPSTPTLSLPALSLACSAQRQSRVVRLKGAHA